MSRSTSRSNCSFTQLLQVHVAIETACSLLSVAVACRSPQKCSHQLCAVTCAQPARSHNASASVRIYRFTSMRMCVVPAAAARNFG